MAATATAREMGPSIVQRLRLRDDRQLATLIRDGIPLRGMPPSVIDEAELTALVRFLRTIEREPAADAAPRTFQTTRGTAIEGAVLGEGFDDLQLRTADGRVRLLRREGNRVREVTSETGWPGYNGDPGGNRYTTLAQIDKTNVARLAPRWMFTFPRAGGLQGTPVVVDGIMYVTAPNECIALDAGSGRQIWHFQRPRTQGVVQGHANRGAVVAGDRVFMMTDNAHVIALNRWTGALLWDAPLADWRQNYSATSAPLTAGNLVISGVAGGEHGANGFVAAHDQESGKEVWRFWTVPKPGEPGSETWKGTGPAEHRGAATWFTGSYDPGLDPIYWPVGNPSQEYNGDDRQGDNLYANSLVALERTTGAAEVVLPVHAARLVGLGCDADVRDRGRRVAGAVAQAAVAREPQRLLLRVRSHRRHAAPHQALRPQPDLGERHRRRRTADQAAGTSADRRRHQGLSVTGRRHQLVLAVVQPEHRALLRADLREVQHLYESRRRHVGEPASRISAARSAPGPIRCRSASSRPLISAPARSDGSCRSPGRRSHGAERLSTSTGLVIFGEEGGALMAADAITGAPLWSFGPIRIGGPRR